MGECPDVPYYCGEHKTYHSHTRSVDCVEKLLADLAQARQERDAALKKLESADFAYQGADVYAKGLEQERDTLREALQAYGQHRGKCAALAHPIAVGEVAIAKSEKAIERSVKKLQQLERRHLACTCGLTVVLGGTDG